MHRDFTLEKRVILIVLGLLLAADIGLGVYSWLLASAPHTPQSDFDAQNLQLKVLRGDIKSAELIKDNMPATKKDCDKFEAELLPESTGYSIVTAELYDTGKRQASRSPLSASNIKRSRIAAWTRSTWMLPSTAIIPAWCAS